MSQETFERELARRAEDVHGAPFSFEDVRGRATSIRRRRRATAAGAVAAAVALVVLVPTLLLEDTTRSDRTIEPAAPVSGRTAVLHDGTLTLPDGGEVALDVDNADVSQLSVLTDGRIVLAMMEPYAVRVYGSDGTIQEEFGVQSNALTTSPAGDAVAWIGEDFRSRVLASGVAEPTTMDGFPMPGESAGSIDAVLDAEHLLGGDWSTTGYSITPEGRADLTTSEPLRVTDVSPDGDLWAVQYQGDSDPQYGCVGLYDPQADEMVARSCDAANLDFAPDGEHLISRFAENVGQSSELTVLDLDLREVTTFRPDGLAIKEAAWEDGAHLLATVGGLDQSPQWSVLRIPIDGGDPDTVAGPVPGPNPEFPSEFLLSD